LEKHPIEEAVGYFLHACTSGLWGKDRAELKPEVQGALLELESRLSVLLEEFRDDKQCKKPQDTDMKAEKE